jgi:outer membrane protein assembly factor BamD
MLIMLAVCGPAALAQRTFDEDEFAVKSNDIEEQLDRKTPGWIFHKPAESNPASQLKLAEQIEKAGNKSKAGRAYNALVHKWHDSPEAVTAQLALARILAERGKYSDAFDEYQYLTEYFQGRFKYSEVMDAQFKIANQMMTMKHWDFLILPGFKDPVRAIPLFEKIIGNAPGWNKTPEALFNIGLINEDEESYDEAIDAYERLVNRYPNCSYAAEAAYRSSKCLCLQVKRAKYDEGSYRTAMASLAAFRRDYPEHPGNEEAGREINRLYNELGKIYYEKAYFYDYKAKKPDAAVIAYSDFLKQFPNSELADQAEKRLEELTQAKEKVNEKKSDK